MDCLAEGVLEGKRYPEELLHLKPTEPSPNECCGNGCRICVYDVYEQELAAWENECSQFYGKEKHNCQSKEQETVISPYEYTKCMLSEVVPQTKNCNLYRFTIPSNGKLNLKLGQHLMLRAKVDGSTIFRPYTPVNPLGSPGYFDVLIKVYENGKMSKFVSTWYTGIETEWKGPFGSFEYKPNNEIILVAGGTGIAPMIHLIRAVLEDEEDETRIKLLYGCQTYDDILMKPLLNEFKHFWNFSVTYYLSQESDTTKALYGDDVYYTRINLDILQKKLPAANPETKILICGPADFNVHVKKCVSDIGFSDHQILVF